MVARGWTNDAGVSIDDDAIELQTSKEPSHPFTRRPIAIRRAGWNRRGYFLMYFLICSAMNCSGW